MPLGRTRVGIIGAGYIAQWHAGAIRATKDVELTAICDVSEKTATQLAENLGVRAYASLDDLIEEQVCDAVHVLTPPHTHHMLAVKALEAGLHVMVEKPFATSRVDCVAITNAARSAHRVAAVSHNFLGVPSYQRLKEAYRSDALGRISSAEFNWRFPLEPLRSGPFGLWMLRSAENLLLELGPHLYAFAVDLFGKPEDFQLRVGNPIDIPGGGTHFQSWRILARAGRVDLTFHLSLVETMDDRSIALHGSSGVAHLDFANDTLVIQRKNASDIVVSPLLNEASASWQHLREGVVNATRQAASLNQKSPYALGFRNAVQSFYEAVRGGAPIDDRFSGEAATTVIGAIEDTIAQMPAESKSYRGRAIAPSHKPRPKVLVIGGTGFIGRHLTTTLAASGRDVRVLSRGRTAMFNDVSDKVETVSVSLNDAAGIRAAMDGVEVVYHLAKSLETTWAACLENDVGPTVRIAEAALDANVKRFIYTGTIASYDMSRPDRVITEQTGFSDDMRDRNLYARSKATCEARLVDLHRSRGLPLIIARPGIVIGSGGPLQHWGIGRWHGAGAVRIWGHGRNILPFVLIDDVSDGLIKMSEIDEAVGKSFNLVGDPMMSARDYFDAIRDKLGARIAVHPSSLTSFYLIDAVKHPLKKYALGKRGAIRSSLRDWKSRAHFSPFDNEYPKRILGWKPESDKEAFIRRGILEANIFGF
ncbi:MAG: NAD-dependent epimerase/dehydratase family protein [Hyphomicrobium sp.]